MSFLPPIFDATADDLFVHLSTWPVVIVHADASWNGSMRPTRAALEKIAQEWTPNIHRLTLDVDDPRNEKFLRRLNVLNVPFVAVYLDGELFRKAIGDDPRKFVEAVREAVAGIPWYWRKSPA